MKTLRQIARHLSSWRLLTEEQEQRLRELGVLRSNVSHWRWDRNYQCAICGDEVEYGCNCVVLCRRCGAIEFDDRGPVACECCRDCECFPCQCEVLSGRSILQKKEPAKRVRADDIAKRVEESRILEDDSLAVLDLVVGADWRLREKTLGLPSFLKLLVADRIPCDVLWEALCFQEHRSLVPREEQAGEAYRAWESLLLGLSREELGNRSWVLTRGESLKTVWRLVRLQNFVLSLLGTALVEEAQTVAAWCERNYHPVGSAAMSLAYEACAKQLDGVSDPGRAPEWSNWDGQRYKSVWQGRDDVLAITEKACRLLPNRVSDFVLDLDQYSVESILAHCTHPKYWSLPQIGRNSHN